MRNYFVIILTFIFTSCISKEDIPEKIIYNLNQLKVETLSTKSVNISGSIISGKNDYNLSGGYIFENEKGERKVIVKMNILQEFIDLHENLLPYTNYSVKTYIVNGVDTIFGEPVKFRVSQYKLLMEKRIPLSHMFANLTYPRNTTWFYNCTLDDSDNIIISGYIGYNPFYPYMIKLDKTGNLIWQQTPSLPSEFMSFTNHFVKKNNDIVGLSESQGVLYIVTISSRGNLLDTKKIVLADKDHYVNGISIIDYNRESDIFRCKYSHVSFNNNRVDYNDFCVKMIEFNSDGVVSSSKNFEKNIRFTDFGYIYCQSGNDTYIVTRDSLNIYSRLDKNMKMVWKRRLEKGRYINKIIQRNNNNFLLLTTDFINSSDITVFEFDSLGVTKGIETWNVKSPYINDAMTDRNNNVFVCGANSPELFNSYGSSWFFSSNNTFTSKEINYGIESRIPNKITITEFKFIRKLSDGSTLIVGMWNPDFYDGPTSQIYLRQFSY